VAQRTSAAAAQRARVMRTAVATAAVIALGAAAAWYLGVFESGTVGVDDLAEVALVAAAPDENGDVVAQIVALVDVRAGSLEPVSPATGVTLPGTTYGTLADAYPFGGGAGVAEALARARVAEAPAYLALDAAALRSAVAQAGGAEITLPAEMAVFDGETLYTFAPGATTLSAEELGAVFKGAPYLTDAQRSQLDAELAGMLATLLAEWPGGLAAASDTGAIATNLSPEALGDLQDVLR
jgi:hypothetical protein